MADQDIGIAARLRAARIQQGLGLEALARELKNPLGVLESIERGDWARLGAPVFARHLVGRYASRLGVAVDLDEVARGLVAPELRSQVPASRIGRFADFSARHAAYAGGTLLVVPLVYALLTMTANGPVQVRPLDTAPLAGAPAGSLPVPQPAPAVATIDGVPEGAASALPGVTEVAPAAAPADAALSGDTALAATPDVSVPVAAPTPTTVAASLAGGVTTPSGQLELRFSGESWIEVLGRNGSTLERVLAREGDVRRFAVADVGRVTIGNVEATSVVLDGSSVNLEAVRAANVARFALSSDGSIEAVAR